MENLPNQSYYQIESKLDLYSIWLACRRFLNPDTHINDYIYY